MRLQDDSESGCAAVYRHCACRHLNAIPERDLREQERRAIMGAGNIHVAQAVLSLRRRGEKSADPGRGAHVQPAAVETVGDELGLDGLQNRKQVFSNRQIAPDIGGEGRADLRRLPRRRRCLSGGITTEKHRQRKQACDGQFRKHVQATEAQRHGEKPRQGQSAQSTCRVLQMINHLRRGAYRYDLPTSRRRICGTPTSAVSPSLHEG